MWVSLTKKTLMTIGALTLLVVGISKPAGATGDATAAAALIIEFLKTYFTDMLSPEQAKQTGRTITAIGSATDAMRNQEVELYNARIAFESTPPPNLCTTKDMGVATTNASEITKQLERELGEPLLDLNVGVKNAFSVESEKLKRHDAKFCGPQDVDCNESEMANADVSAWIAMGKENFNQSELDAAHQYIANLTNPTPTPPLPTDVANTPQGNAVRNVVMAEASRLSLAQRSFTAIIAERTPSEKLGQALGKPAASPREIWNHEANRRLENPEWAQSIADSPPATALRELALMTAHRIQQEERQYQQGERVEALMAALLAVETKRWSKEELGTLRKQAVKAVPHE